MSYCRRWAPVSLVTVFVAALTLVSATAQAQPVLPSSFQETTVITGLTQPTMVKFAKDGRIFVAEKSGLIKVFDSLTDTTPDVFADLRTEVYNFWDRGLLGLELHPDFPNTPYVYALYTLDRLPRSAWVDPNPNDGIVNPPIPQWGVAGATTDGCPNPPGATNSGCAVTGRLSRLVAIGNSAVSVIPLIDDWCQQFPSHSIGSLAFGSDGALYVSGGDGASFNYADYGQTGGTGGIPQNVCGDPPVGVGSAQNAVTSEGGALRSQSLRRRAGPAVLGGTILRVNPETGEGASSNTLAYSSDPLARRIVAYGLRNPFRITARPGTSEIWIGDVGWNTWEEINRLPDPTGAVHNFGWPCYEGVGRQGGYDGLENALCENLYNGVIVPGVDPTAAGTLVSPFYTYNHDADVVSGDVCPPNPTGQVSSSIAGLAFYRGGPYPSSYDGALFFADYSRDCIWAMMPGTNGIPNPASRLTFVGRASNPVALESGPNGDLFYVDLDGGTIRRVAYLGANNAPVGVLTADKTVGNPPLTVQFTGAASTDPDSDPLSFAWDLDNDGQFDDAATVSTSRTFVANGVYTVRLRVTDDRAASDVETVTIRVGNIAPTAIIASPIASRTWKVGDLITFSGSASDPQDGTLAGASLTWTLIVNHCPNNSCHQHTVQTWNGGSGSFTAPDHEYPSSLELRLTAVDSGGLSDTKNVVLQPQTVALTFASSPASVTLGFNAESAAAPITRTVIIGSSNSISAPSPQTVGGVGYTFQSWSDGGAAAHNVIAPATARTYTAAFTSTTPGGLSSRDIGSPGVAGSSSLSGSTYTLRGGGADIWETSDAFRFTYQQVSGNASIVARVGSLQNTNVWAKAGVMIRESLAPNARHVMMVITPGNGAAFQRRTSTGGSSTHTAGPSGTAPYSVRVVRSGNTFTASVSSNGSTWTTVGSVTVSMASTAYAGLAVTSHNNSVTATATFTQVTIVP